jgi:hypothetical protein
VSLVRDAEVVQVEEYNRYHRRYKVIALIGKISELVYNNSPRSS